MTMRVLLAGLLGLSALTGPANAEGFSLPLEPVPLASSDHRLLEVARRAQGGSTPVSIGPNGAVMFPFGAGQPTVICAVLQVCDIELQPGEEVNDVKAGDAVRWVIEPAFSGTADGVQVTHVTVKPTDVGLDTTLTIYTSRRAYHIRLKSHETDFMPRVVFSYPEDLMSRWKQTQARAVQERQDRTIPETREYLGDLDFNYRIRGAAPWVPVRVYNDGRKTIIQMPREMGQTEAPILLLLRKEGGLLSDDETALVNYRLIGDRYIVDTVFDRAVLVAGVDSDQHRVLIERETRRR